MVQAIVLMLVGLQNSRMFRGRECISSPRGLLSKAAHTHLRITHATASLRTYEKHLDRSAALNRGVCASGQKRPCQEEAVGADPANKSRIKIGRRTWFDAASKCAGGLELSSFVNFGVLRHPADTVTALRPDDLGWIGDRNSTATPEPGCVLFPEAPGQQP
jgi:hypothetical protein